MQVLEKVELVVPSNLTAPLRVCDVPGFGDDSLDPFRQQLVNEALKLAAEAAITVLRVDSIIMSKPAGGPKPEEQM